LGRDQVQDVAIYVNTEAKYDPADSGKAVDDPALSSAMPHVEAALCVTKTLIENHIPFGIITRASLGQLARHKMIILPNMLALSRPKRTLCGLTSRRVGYSTPADRPR